MALSNIEKLAIANRGEVAVRIIRACQELGVESVLLHSEVDEASMAYRLADERICIGPAPLAESYLNIDANVQAAVSAGADALHPGFGFLSENADFAQACLDARVGFVGPSPQSIRLFGDKISAKALVAKAGVPCIPGYQGEDQSLERLVEESERIGFPVICKAAAGGGGRGLKVIRGRDEAADLIESAQREGQSSFGSSRVFLEKYLDQAKHIEVQIFGSCDGQVYHLFERECSVQRRHQKIIEESLSPALSEELRQKICEAARSIAKEAQYQGAGTVEFLVQDGQFYFMEMNTRLQVEHPVTEMVMGIDLVKAQIMTADQQSLLWDMDMQPRGHSIECRLYAEDPYKQGMPSTGHLGFCSFPMGAGRRFEVGFEEGDEVTPMYDPMIAKIIVHDESRPRAIQKMKATLRETIVFGVKTNIPLLLELLSHPEFVEGTMTTRFFDSYFSEGLTSAPFSESEINLAKSLNQSVLGQSLTAGATEQRDSVSPWSYPWEAR